MEQIKEGLPPIKINRIVKSVKYMLYWEFDSKENYGAAQKRCFDSVPILQIGQGIRFLNDSNKRLLWFLVR